MSSTHRTLSAYLAAKGITQSAFAARVGVKQSLISRIVKGDRTPSLALALRISEAARIPVRSLLGSGGSRQVAA